MKQKILGVIVGITIGLVLVACGGSDAGSNSSSGLTKTEVETMISDALTSYENRIAQLEAEVATLKKSVNVVVAQPRTATAMMAKATANDEPQSSNAINCAASGYLPATQFTAEYIQCTTPQGFLVDVPKEGGAPRPLTAFYETADCSGTAWVRLSEVVGALRNGAVLSYPSNLGLQVGYFLPNPQPQTVTVQAAYAAVDGTCSPYGGTRVLSDLIEVLPHEVGGDGLNTDTGAMNDYPPSVTTPLQ